MAESLFLNKIKVDIFDSPITRKIQIGDVSEIASFKSSYSYTIRLPRTSKNISILDMLGVPGNTSLKPYTEIVCDYYINELPIVTNGIAVIRDTGKEFNLNIIDGVKSLADLLSGKKITDLSLSSLEHSLTLANFISSLSNTSGYIYAFADFGKPVNSSILSTLVAESAPDPIPGPHNVPLDVIHNDNLGGAQTVIVGSSSAFYKVLTEIDNISIRVIYDVDFDINEDGTSFKVTLSQTRTGSSVDLGSASGNTGDSVNISFDTTTPFSDVQIGDLFYLKVVTNILSTNEYVTTGDYGCTVICTAQTILKIENLAPSIFLHTLINQIAIDNDIEFVGDLFTANSDYLTEVLSPCIGYDITTIGQTIKPIELMGDINQFDLIKDVANRYGLVLIPNQLKNKYRFTRIEDLLTIGNFEDWTSKLSSLDRESYNSGYARQNKGVYNYSSDQIKGEYDGLITINDVNLEKEKTLISSIFEIPITGQKISGNTVLSIPIWNAEGNNLTTPIKLLRIEEKTTDVIVKLLNDASSQNITTDSPYLSRLNIDYQYYFDTYYSKFSDLLNNYRKIEASILLSSIDIYNLDFEKLIYLKQTGQYYLLNSVQYTEGNISKVELIEL